MRKFKIFFSILFIFFYFFTGAASANLSLGVSPIKYELEVEKWTTITKTAKLINRTDKSLSITTWKSDFVTDGNTWKPKFVRKSELVHPDQQLSSWVNIGTESFVLWPKQEKEVIFTIDIPSNATPGGHYWAVFFHYQTQEEKSGNQVSINVDYWVLILVNVEGEVIKEWEVKDVIIKSSGSSWSSWWANRKDNCPLWDMSYSYYDGLCIDNPFTDKENLPESIEVWENTETIEENWEISDIVQNWNSIENTDQTDWKTWKETQKNDFNIQIDIPFENKGNTHIKPSGRIILKDEDGQEFEWVGKEIIKDIQGIIVGEKIVDYLPINDIWWNVLPQSERNFQSEWKWFPYQAYNEKWEIIIKYWSPAEYFTQQNIQEKSLLMFWEREREKNSVKKITADIEFVYKDAEGQDIAYNSAKEFDIEYTEKYIALNYLMIIPAGMILSLLFLFFIWKRSRKISCKKCGKKIDKHMKACPYCGKKTKKSDKKDKKKKSK